ncbi:MAG TPA: hypothetical protein DCG12_06105 [Planctomycetaceae bacterium]|nr:hypothetical protein [Planctomycetaceae bacterium]
MFIGDSDRSVKADCTGCTGTIGYSVRSEINGRQVELKCDGYEDAYGFATSADGLLTGHTAPFVRTFQQELPLSSVAGRTSRCIESFTRRTVFQTLTCRFGFPGPEPFGHYLHLPLTNRKLPKHKKSGSICRFVSRRGERSEGRSVDPWVKACPVFVSPAATGARERGQGTANMLMVSYCSL